MRSLLEIRKKTGLSQQQLADYLGISRSLVAMAEKSLRDLPKTALSKLTAMENVISTAEKNKKAIPETADEKITKKIKSFHQIKMEDHLFRAKMLQRRLAAMLKSNEQADVKLKLIDGLSKKTAQTQKNKFDDHWLEYHDQKGRKKIFKNFHVIQMLTLDIEVQLGYAAVHEKILNKIL